MEAQGMIYESPREAMERDSAPHFRNFDEEDADDYQTNSMRSRRREKYNNGTYDKHAVPPSLAEQIRQTSSRKSQPEYESHGDAASKCIQNNFDITSAKSIAFSLVNPCGLSPSDVVNPLPATPSTACGSFSDDSETSQSLCSPRDVKATLLQRGSGKSKGDSGLESRRTFLQAHTTNANAEDGDIVIFVGSQEYRFPCSGGSLNFASKYFLRRREEAKHFSFVDLSTHSPEEFKIVMKFFENNPARDAWSHIHWKNLPVILPWFVEFQALPLMSAVDTFLLQNAFSAAGDRYRADNSNNNNKYRHISLSSLLSLMEIAFACGLESTKLHARRLLRRCLLEPRKQSTNPDLDSSRDSEQAAEDIELEWTLQDLQVLAKLLKNHVDLREYLWEVAVIIYLPHDLDISDSIGLVSNTLFPYLLREGMMQMMIVEGIESSFQTTDNSFLTESSGTSSILANSKALGSSFSEQTSCSDATIPTTPSSQLKYLTEKEVHQYLKKIIKQLEKFKAEKEARTTMQQDQPHNSLVVDEPGDDLHTRPRRLYASAENRSSTRSRDSRGVTTFAC